MGADSGDCGSVAQEEETPMATKKKRKAATKARGRALHKKKAGNKAVRGKKAARGRATSMKKKATKKKVAAKTKKAPAKAKKSTAKKVTSNRAEAEKLSPRTEFAPSSSANPPKPPKSSMAELKGGGEHDEDGGLTLDELREDEDVELESMDEEDLTEELPLEDSEDDEPDYLEKPEGLATEDDDEYRH